MRDASRVLIAAIAAAALAACNPSASENNVAIDINDAAPGDIEQLPPDESVDTGTENADANVDANAPSNSD